MEATGQDMPRDDSPSQPATPAGDSGAESTQAQLREVNEQLLLASLRERELADQVRQQATERAAILEQVTDGIILTDPAGRITYVNAAARRLHGTGELGVPVAGWADAYHLLTLDGKPFPAEELPLARAVQRGETVVDALWRIRRRDGTEVVAEGSATPVLAEDGTPVSAVLICRDVTAQHALEKQKDDFFTAAAHDLQSPLTVIKGYAQILLRQLQTPTSDAARLVAGLEQIETVSTQMSMLIRELLDLTQLQKGQSLNLNRQATDLVALSLRVVAELEVPGVERRIQVACPTGTLTGLWDAAKLERVLINLLTNAVKFSPVDAEIRLTLIREDGGGGRQGDRASAGAWAVVRVQDQGTGIPSAELPRIFERFQRGSNVAGRVAGTGIGLASAKQIVVQHGGTITIASREGAGTTVTVRLPLTA